MNEFQSVLTRAMHVTDDMLVMRLAWVNITPLGSPEDVHKTKDQI